MDSSCSGRERRIYRYGNLTYNIVRHPDEKELNNITATSLDDELTPATAMMYSYDVTAVNHSHKGKAATSNAVMYGNGYEVPWTEKFDNASSLNMFTIVDANNDGSTWGWSRFKTKAVTYTYNDKNAADDWLITPPIALKAGKKYKLTFDEHVTNSEYPEKLEIKYGNGLDYAAYTEVMSKTTFTNADFETKTIILLQLPTATITSVSMPVAMQTTDCSISTTWFSMWSRQQRLRQQWTM